MKIGFKNVNFYQEGGAMAPAEEAPVEAPQEQGNPMDMLMQLAQMAVQALQNQDANMAMQVCEGLVQFVQMVQGGGEAAPAEPESEPVYKKGGKLCKRVKKEACGSKMKK
jgi:hypothetical protein